MNIHVSESQRHPISLTLLTILIAITLGGDRERPCGTEHRRYMFFIREPLGNCAI